MAFRIAAISDIHYKDCELDICTNRRSAIASILLRRAVHRLNRYIKPDVTVILGDLIDDPKSPNAVEDMNTLKSAIDLLQSPVIVMPGNHDLCYEDFYSVFPEHSNITDIGNVRFVMCFDQEEPGYNARRTEADLRLMSAARSGHEGPIISLQHTPLFAPGTGPSPYSLVNAKEAWEIFENNHYTLALSGHYHPGDDQIEKSTGKSITVPALCESPFSFMEIEIDGDNITTRRHNLNLPPELKLIDYHIHSPFAYCQVNMNPKLTIKLASEFGLGGFSFTEHSGQLYFDRDTFWGAKFMNQGIDTQYGRVERMHAYLDMIKNYCPPAHIGFEIDCDYKGRPVIRPQDMQQAQVKLGSIHWLEELQKDEPDIERASQEMLRRLSVLLKSGVQILAHPFRVFYIKKQRFPDYLVESVVNLLKEHNVAAEINFHNQITEEELVTKCVNAGVKLVFGSDSHELYETGELYPHLQLMERCGYSNSDLHSILGNFTRSAT